MTRRRIVCLLSVLLIGPAARGDCGSNPKAMDGTWKPLAAELAGAPWPKEILDTIKLTVKEGKYIVKIGEQSDEGTVTVNASKSPCTMDITGTEGPNKGKTMLVIYELKDDQLRVCYDLSGKSRPTEFATKPKTQLFLVTYRKEKP